MNTEALLKRAKKAEDEYKAVRTELQKYARTAAGKKKLTSIGDTTIWRKLVDYPADLSPHRLVTVLTKLSGK